MRSELERGGSEKALFSILTSKVRHLWGDPGEENTPAEQGEYT